jgi:rhodanese-related sulfurtransferase
MAIIKNKINAEVIAFFLFLFLAGYSVNLKRAYEESKVVASFQRLSAEELLTRIQGGYPVFLIDCRPPEEYCAGHIPRASNVSMDSFTFNEKTVLKYSIDEISKRTNKKLVLILVDAESLEEYMPKSKIEELVNHMPEDRNQQIIFYCRRPDCTRSPMAIRWVQALGYKNVWRYQGGWKEWSEKDYPLEK